MITLDNFAAIDFEMANLNSSSVCSIGVVIVKDRKIKKSIYHLIHPRPNYFNWFSNVHGIYYFNTKDSPLFPVIWARVAPQIEGLPLVAHNSSVDERYLRAAHKMFNMEYPQYTFYCTLRASHKLFGNQLRDHRLATVAAHYGYNITNRHQALADAEACAVIALQLFRVIDPKTVQNRIKPSKIR
jgi:DNA polymerase-3 subunit epsilon